MAMVSLNVKGTQLARYTSALARTNGNHRAAAEFARQQWPDTPVVSAALQKTAVASANTTTAGWASELVNTGLAADFLEAVRARTVLDRLNLVRRVPLHTRVPIETGAVTGSWVAQGEPIRVARSTFELLSLASFRAATIVVLTREQIESVDPVAIASIRETLVRGVIAYLDQQFLDPSIAAVTDVSPGSITNGATQIPYTGSTAAAMTEDLGNMVNAADDLVSPVWVMRAKTCASLAGTLQLSEIKIINGTLLGIPIITTKSQAAPVGSPAVARLITLIDQDAVVLADDGQVDIAVSSATALQMSDAPSSGPQNAVSMFQTDSSAVRVTRGIAWQRARDTGVVYMEVPY